MPALRILFYGKLVDLFGREAEIDWPEEGASIGAVKERLAALHPQGGAELLKSSHRACVGDEMVDEGHFVRPGETVEFFPPVSGG